MMVRMRLQRIIRFAALLALVTALATGLAVLNGSESVSAAGWAIISRFVVVLMFGGLGLIVAHESHIRGSIVITSEEWMSTVRDVMNWGILPGLVLGVINYFFFFAYRYSPFVAPRFREMNSYYDSFILSLNSGLTEEVVFRLFFLSCLLFSFRQLYERLRPMWPSLVGILPIALALVSSSLLFALDHNLAGFTAAFFGGMLLGWIYIRSGIESAIAAHFAANFLFYSASYVLKV
jgi:membrane protease YdiL (CAAX protease family)